MPYVSSSRVVVLACDGDESNSDNQSVLNVSGALPQGSETVDLNPADFSLNIDNPTGR